MSRYTFGYEQSALDAAGNIVPTGTVITFWDAQTSGTQIMDLTLIDGTPATSAPTNSSGQFPIKGPDGVTKMWAQGVAASRFAVVTDDLTDIIATMQATIVTLQSSGDTGAFTALQAEQDAQGVQITNLSTAFTNFEANLAPVALSGDYNSLINAPPIVDSYTKAQTDLKYVQTINGKVPVAGDVAVTEATMVHVPCPSDVKPLRVNTPGDQAVARQWMAKTQPTIGSGYATNAKDYWNADGT